MKNRFGDEPVVEANEFGDLPVAETGEEVNEFGDKPAPDTLGEQVGYLGSALGTGVKRGVEMLDVVAASGDEYKRRPGFREYKKAQGAMLGDPRWLGQLNPIKPLGVKHPIADGGQLNPISGEYEAAPMFSLSAQESRALEPYRTMREARALDIAKQEEELAARPKSQTMRKWEALPDNDGWAMAKAIAHDPVEIIGTIALESLPQSLMGLPLGPAGIGMASAANEFSSSLVSEAYKKGYDLRDPREVQRFFEDPKVLGEAKKVAGARAGVIGTFDAATAGLAGVFMRRALGKGAARVGGALLAETGMQGLGGGGGEYLGAKLAGQDPSLKDVVAEVIGEFGGAPAETVSNLRGDLQERRQGRVNKFLDGLAPAVRERQEGVPPWLVEAQAGRAAAEGQDLNIPDEEEPHQSLGESGQPGEGSPGPIDWQRVGVVQEDAAEPGEDIDQWLHRRNTMARVRELALAEGLGEVDLRWAPELRHGGKVVESWPDSKDGHLVVNAAAENLWNTETARPIFREEGGHQLLRSDSGRKAVRQFALERMTEEERLALQAQGYTRPRGMNDEQYRDWLANEFIAKSAREQSPFWRVLVERVKKWISDASGGRFKLTNEEAARAILRTLKVEQTRGRKRAGAEARAGEMAEGDLTPQMSIGQTSKKQAQENLRAMLARRAGTGVAKNQALRFTTAEGKPIWIGADAATGGKPFNAWMEELDHWLSKGEVDKARQWYGELKTVFDRKFGKRNSGRMMAAWLAAQQNVSPAGAMQNMFRVEDRLGGIEHGLRGGLADQKLEGILTGNIKGEGFGPKLTDFIDAGHGRATRSYVGDDPRGGGPFVADVHTGRDSGHVDQQTLRRLTDMAEAGNLKVDGKPVAAQVLEESVAVDDEGKEKSMPLSVGFSWEGGGTVVNKDMTGSPKDNQYEGVSNWGQRLSEHLNKVGFHGGGWTPAQAQAAGWMRILKQYDLPAGTVESAILSNTHRLSAEVAYGMGNLLPAHYPNFGNLSPQAQRAITKEVLEETITDLARIIGGSLRVSELSMGVGFWRGFKFPSIQAFVMGSEEAADLLRDALALVTEQAGTMRVTFGKGGKASRAVVMMMKDGRPLSTAQMEDFVRFVNEDRKNKNYIEGWSAVPLPGQKGHVIAKLGEARAAKIYDLANAWSRSRNIAVVVRNMPAESEESEHDWKADPRGGSYVGNINRRGGNSRIRAILDYRRTYTGRLEEAIARHAPGAANPAQRQARLDAVSKPLEGETVPAPWALHDQPAPTEEMTLAAKEARAADLKAKAIARAQAAQGGETPQFSLAGDNQPQDQSGVHPTIREGDPRGSGLLGQKAEGPEGGAGQGRRPEAAALEILKSVWPAERDQLVRGLIQPAESDDPETSEKILALRKLVPELPPDYLDDKEYLDTGAESTVYTDRARSVAVKVSLEGVEERLETIALSNQAENLLPYEIAGVSNEYGQPRLVVTQPFFKGEWTMDDAKRHELLRAAGLIPIGLYSAVTWAGPTPILVSDLHHGNVLQADPKEAARPGAPQMGVIDSRVRKLTAKEVEGFKSQLAQARAVLDALKAARAQATAQGTTTPQFSLQQPAAGEEQRKLAGQVEKAPDVSEAVRSQLRNPNYNPRRNEDDAAAAARILKDAGGPEAGIDLFRNRGNGMPEAVRGFLGQLVVKQLGAAERASVGDPAKAQALAERAARFMDEDLFPATTSAGQFIQSFRAFAGMTPEGMVQVYHRTMKRAGKRVRERVRGPLTRIRQKLEDLNAGALPELGQDPQAQAATGEAVDKGVKASQKVQDAVRVQVEGDFARSGRIRDDVARVVRKAFERVVNRKTPSSLWERYRAAAASQLAKLPDGAKPRDRAALEEFTARVVETLRGQIEGATARPPAAPGQKAPRIAPVAQILEAFANPEKFAQIWKDTIARLREEYPNDPRVDFLATQPAGLVSPGAMRRALEAELTRADVGLTELLAHGYRVGGGKPIIDRIRGDLAAAGLDLDAADVEGLSKSATQEWQRLMQEAQGKLGARVKAAKDRESRAIRAIKSGLVAPGEVPQDELDQAIRDELKRLRSSIGSTLREHYSGWSQAGQRLAERLASRTGLPKAEAEALASKLEERFKKLLSGRRRELIMRMASAVPRKYRAKLPIDHIMELSNLGLLGDEEVWNAMREKLGLPGFSPKVAAEVKKRAEEVQKKPEGFQRDEAAMDLLNYIARESKVPLSDMGMAFWYANALSGPVTHLVNGLSNMQQIAAHTAFAATRDPRGVPGLLRATADGFMGGLGEAGRVLKTGKVTGSRAGLKMEPSGPLEVMGEEGWRKIANKWKYVARALSAADLLFYKTAEAQRAHVLSRALARDEGLEGRALEERTRAMLYGTAQQQADIEAQVAAEGHRGTARSKRTRELRDANRPSGVGENARDYALRTVFNGEPSGLLGTVAKWLKPMLAEAPVLRLVAPFIDVVANVTNEALNYFPPVGIGRAVAGRHLGSLNGKPLDLGTEQGKADLYDQQAKSVVGLVALSTIAAAAAKGIDKEDPDFAVYGAGPSDPAAKALLKSTGWRPWTIKVGNRYVNYADSPLAIGLATLGSYMDNLRWKKMDQADALDRVATGLAAWPRVVVQRSFLKGISDLFGTLSSETSPSKAAERGTKLVTGPLANFGVPNLVRQVERFFDPKVTDTSTVKGGLLSQVPFVRRLGRPALTPLGDPVESHPLDRIMSKQGGDKLANLMARKEAWVSAPEQGELTGDEHYELIRRRGQLIRQGVAKIEEALKKNAGGPKSLEEMPPVIVQEILRPLVQKADGDLREEMLRARGVVPISKRNLRLMEALAPAGRE